MIVRYLTIAPLLLVTAAGATEPLELQTQYETAVPVTGDGEPRIVVYSDQEGATQAKAWGDVLGDSDCPAIAAANLSAVPELVREMVVEDFEGRDPVALDWEGRVAKRFGFSPGVANIYLLDDQGRVEIHLEGAPESRKLERLTVATRNVCAADGR